MSNNFSNLAILLVRKSEFHKIVHLNINQFIYFFYLILYFCGNNNNNILKWLDYQNLYHHLLNIVKLTRLIVLT